VQTADSSHMRMLNLHLILKMLWKEESISRAEIARRTGLARSTVSEIVARLLEYGLILETGAVKSWIGRRPIQLVFNNDAYGIVGVDMGVTHVGVVVTNMAGEVKVYEQIEHQVRPDPVGTLGRMMSLTDKCIEASGFSQDQLIGISIAVPSPVDPAEPESCLSPLILPHWKGWTIYGEWCNCS